MAPLTRAIQNTGEMLPMLRETSDVPSLDLFKKRRKTRRESMIHVLRNDLINQQQLPAAQRRRESLSSDNQDPFSIPSTSRTRRSSLSFSERRSLRRSSSVSSDASGDVNITEYEWKKIQMLQSLDAMGVKMPKPARKTSGSGEVNLYENLRLHKRQSLTTRMLMATQNRRAKKRLPSVSDEESPKNGSPELNQEQKEKLQKITEIMKEKKSSGDGGTLVLPSMRRSSIVSESGGGDILGNFRKRIRRKKLKPNNRLKRLVKFIIVLFRSWRIHSKSVNDILGKIGTLDAMTNTNVSDDLLFDITQYKSAKQSSISSETRRILQKKPRDRTDEEIHYLQIALRNYKSIAEYPVNMQIMIARRSWYESYDAKRVIVREGYIPMAFYFILTGSAMVSQTDLRAHHTSTVMLLYRGDSFGEQAIMTQSIRETTVISREKIELLVMSDKDFVDIFMSGGMNDHGDPFLKSIDFLREWPIEKLALNPKRALNSFFKRGVVLVNDSNKNDWLFIVKSGSCRVLKKLDHVNPKKYVRRTKKKHWRERVEEMAKNDDIISHEDQIALLREDEIKRLEQKSMHMRFYALPEINIATNDAYKELRNMREEFMNQTTINRAIGALEALHVPGQAVETESIVTETESRFREEYKDEAIKFRKKSIANLHHMIKGPFLKNRVTTNTPSVSELKRPLSVTTYADAETLAENHLLKQPTIRSTTSTPVAPKERQKPTAIENPPVFVQVKTLTKGMHFGLSDVLFDNQPSFSLVSNGAEVIMIDKKFFMESMDTNSIVRLRENVYPYPTDVDLQKNLEIQIGWNFHKDSVVHNLMRDIQMRRSHPQDARAHLKLPPIR